MNFTSRPALLGLTYRALAANASAAAAPLTRRRIETGRSIRTQLTQKLSQLKGEMAISTDKLKATRRDAEQAGLDLAIFNEEHHTDEAGARRRKRPTPEEAAVEQQRAQLIHLAGLMEQHVARLRDYVGKTAKELEDTERLLGETGGNMATLSAGLGEQLAAHVLDLIASGKQSDAYLALGEAREAVRGSLMIAVLTSLTCLFIDGEDALSGSLNEQRSVYGQYDDPMCRVLEAFAIVAKGEPLSIKEAGVFPKERFSSPGLYRLYQLILVLAGFKCDEQGLEGDPFFATLWALQECKATIEKPPDWQPYPPDALASWAKGCDRIVKLLACHALLRRGEDDAVLAAVGIDPAALKPAGGLPLFSEPLYPLVCRKLVPAWPPGLLEPWSAGLACHVLLAARSEADAALFTGWLTESYDWPKSDLYWWTLGMIKGDAGLMMRNLSGSTDELFSVTPL